MTTTVGRLQIIVHWSRGLPSSWQLRRLLHREQPRLSGRALAAGVELTGPAWVRIWRSVEDLPPPDPFDDDPESALERGEAMAIVAAYPSTCLVAVTQPCEPTRGRREFDEELGGRVVAWAERPTTPSDIDQLCCALLQVDQWRRPVLYPNMGIGCEHAHLFDDVVRLLREYLAQGPDKGWGKLPGQNGSVTGILTQQAVRSLGVAG